MQASCNQGTKVELHVLEGGAYMSTGRDSASAVVRWMVDRFEGKPAPSDC